MSGLCGLTWRAPGEETAVSGAPNTITGSALVLLTIVLSFVL